MTPATRAATRSRPAAGTWPLGRQTPTWVLDRWVAREHGLVVAGPRPSTLIDPIGPQALQAAVRGLLLGFWAGQLQGPAQAGSRPRSDQAFAVLSMCRALYCLEQGVVVSKPAAAGVGEPAARAALAGVGRPGLGLARGPASRRPRSGRCPGPGCRRGRQSADGGLGVFPASVVDEDRHRGQAVERGVWSPVIVEPQPTGEGPATFGVGAIQPGIGPLLQQGLLNRSTLPLVWGR